MTYTIPARFTDVVWSESRALDDYLAMWADLRCFDLERGKVKD